MSAQRTKIHQDELTLNIPIDQAWSLVSAFGAIQTWMPSIKWVTVDGEGIGATRTVSGLAGEVQEQLESLDSKAYSLAYRILDPVPLPLKGGFGNWKLEKLGERSTRIIWTADAEDIEPDAVPKVKEIYQPFMKESLAGLGKCLSY